MVGIDNWEPLVRQDERFMRPAEIHNLRGDASWASKALGWYPKTSFDEMIHIMVQNDLRRHDAN